MSEKPYQGSPVNETSTESIKAWLSERKRIRLAAADNAPLISAECDSFAPIEGLVDAYKYAEKFERLVDVLLGAANYCAVDDPLAVDPKRYVDYGSANEWKKMRAREAIAKAAEIIGEKK